PVVKAENGDASPAQCVRKLPVETVPRKSDDSFISILLARSRDRDDRWRTIPYGACWQCERAGEGQPTLRTDDDFLCRVRRPGRRVITLSSRCLAGRCGAAKESRALRRNYPAEQTANRRHPEPHCDPGELHDRRVCSVPADG